MICMSSYSWLTETEYIYINAIKLQSQSFIICTKLKAELLLRPRTPLTLRQTLSIPLPEPFINLSFISNLIVRLIVSLFQFAIVLFHVLGHIFSNVALFVDIGRFSTGAEGWPRFVGRLLFAVEVFVLFLYIILV